jgi:hypothetical protein
MKTLLTAVILDGGIVLMCGNVAEEVDSSCCSTSLGALGLSHNKTTKGNKHSVIKSVSMVEKMSMTSWQPDGLAVSKCCMALAT